MEKRAFRSLVADRVGHPHARGRGDGQRAAATGLAAGTSLREAPPCWDSRSQARFAVPIRRNFPEPDNPLHKGC